MDSIRLAGRAPQLTATKGLPARSLAPCRARAMTSLPTPLSPVIRTGMEDLAARAPSALTIRMAGLSPTMSSKLVRPWARLVRRPTSAVSRFICRALRTPTSSRSGPTGLTKKSWAPACMALTTMSMPPLAVRTITGSATPAAAQFGQTFQARHLGHHHVQQDQVRPAALDHPVDGLAAAGRMDHGVSVPLQHGLDQPALGRIVVDDQNGLGHGAVPCTFAHPVGMDRFGTISRPAR